MKMKMKTLNSSLRLLIVIIVIAPRLSSTPALYIESQAPTVTAPPITVISSPPSPPSVVQTVLRAPTPSPPSVAQTVLRAPTPSPPSVAQTVLPAPTPSPPSVAQTVLPAPTPSPSPSTQPITDSSNGSPSILIGIIAGAIVGGIVIVGLSIWGLVFCFCRKKTPQIQGNDAEPLFSNQFTHFSYQDLKVATHNFHENNRLGAGGFGSVYKGQLVNGVQVAIKKLSANSNQGKHEFMNEVRVITAVQHINLIKLYGCCSEGSERLLVYEYLPNKSLDKFLFDYENSGSILDWKIRLNIILGTARGLAYLHHESQVRIIHRDIKASNILLDSDHAPKIADFGLARLFSHDASHVITKVAGTFGYISPEYALRGKLTVKVDVFSFGIVALEILSGRSHTDLQQPPEKENLVDWAWKCYEEREQMQLVDPRLSNTMNPPIEEEVDRVVHMALLCLQTSPNDRPSMKEVVQMLGGQTQILDRTPNMPQYVFPVPHDGASTSTHDAGPSTHPLPSSVHCSNSAVSGR